MAIFDLFSKRMKRERGETPDVFGYDDIPNPLRVQIVHIWKDALGNVEAYYDYPEQMAQAYENIVGILRREYGTFALIRGQNRQVYEPFFELVNFLLSEKSVEKVLDVIEISFRYMDDHARENFYLGRGPKSDKIVTEAIDELNQRFKEHGVGYYYIDGKLIRVDSEFIHKETVKPVLVVLRQKGYESAEREFLAAHEHYRHGRNSEALVECYKAFESIMKIIATKRNWGDVQNKPAAQLVNLCLINGLIPAYWQAHFTGLRQILESAIPTPRNRSAGHGAGAAPSATPPNELTSYVLHMTASTILFLTEADKGLP
jgi:hypothetical protein